MRRGMAESSVWEKAQQPQGGAAAAGGAGVSQLLSRRNIGALLFLMGMYGFWNLFAGTNGFFLPYILSTVGSQSQATSVALQCAIFVLSMLSIAFVFMRLVDTANQKYLLGFASAIQVVGIGCSRSSTSPCR